MARSRARKSIRVVLSDADIELVADALIDVLPIAVIDVVTDPRTIGELLEPLGANRRERIRRGAIALSGTSDSKSRAYKSARRRLERYTTTEAKERRKPAPTILQQIARTIRRPHLPMDAGLCASMVADVIYVGQTKRMPAIGCELVQPRSLGRVRAALRSGDAREAAVAFLDEWVFAYGLHTERSAAGIIGNIAIFNVEVVTK